VLPNNQSPQPTGAAGGGYQYFTSIWVETDFVTRTSVWSSWVGAPAEPTPTSTENDCTGEGRQWCGGTCCWGGYYCYDHETQDCRNIGGSSSPGLTGTYSLPSVF
jgi:hypothetical protein